MRSAAAPGTLVALMAASTAATFAGRLIAAGRRPDEPVALVHAARTEQQDVLRLTLTALAAGGVDVHSPSAIVIGEVARFAAAGPPAHGRGAPPRQRGATGR